MRTAREMYEFCVKNKYGSGFDEKSAIKHFKIIEEKLINDEEILMCFIGLHNYISALSHESNFAYVITNKRLVYGQKKFLGEHSKEIHLDNINDITFITGAVFGVITIHTATEKINIALNKLQANNLNIEIQKIFKKLKSNSNIIEEKTDSFEEIRKFKKLLDEEIITLEEFENKKKQLLGL